MTTVSTPGSAENAVDNILNRPEIQQVLSSDIAINTLLTKLKQSILTCEEFSKYIKKKVLIEQEHAEEMSKAYKNFFSSTSNSLTKSIAELLQFDGKLSSVKTSYVIALQKMHDELNALLLTMSKARKQVKDHSRRLEKEVMEAIHQAEKAKSKYDSLCQDWSKLRMSDPTKTKLTLRGSKTTREQEEELQRKIDAADLEYKQRVDHATSLRNSFISRERPKIVVELKDMILEMDIAISIQLQKYAIWTENLMLNSGISVCPVNNTSSNTKSMKSVASSMSSEYDLYNYLKKYTTNDKNRNALVNKNLIPVEYKKNSNVGGSSSSKISKPVNGTFVMNSNGKQVPSSTATSNSSPNTFTNHGTNNSISSTTSTKPANTNPYGSSITPKTSNNYNSNRVDAVQNGVGITTNTNYPSKQLSPNKQHMLNNNNMAGVNALVGGVGASAAAAAAGSGRSFGYNATRAINGNQNTQGGSAGYGMAPVNEDAQAATYSTLDPSKSPISSVVSNFTNDNQNNLHPNDRPLSHVETNVTLPPGLNKNFKTFGVPLGTLLEFEQDLVPAVVRQCIYVIDKYGLDIEGIYRKSPSVVDVNKLKEEIDTDPANISMILPPKNYTEQNIHLVASLLKTFFSSLPEPFFPQELSPDLKTCLSIEDPTTRKNYMHGIVYKLPDGQYWTLRSLIFHLKRVVQHEQDNRMSLKNLSIVWGPTLISTPPTSEPYEQDSERDGRTDEITFQISAMETLFDVADQAFEPE
ncbi:hypothetical protein ACO0RG_004584 [Hanseniaspora osmophila]|uniref:RHO GTPase-activating protein RGD1 n=1 Tax=Hanseniaspora osmophila TaxID=56408 RepID=A0A1E5RZX1_9ASCO|nr:RHO GTPase-activating protein RGD1 [Hanseniaspora osmophila]